jgi:hypothetical protein
MSLEVEMNHCDYWPSKGSPLKMNVVVKKDISGGDEKITWEY